MDYKMRVFYNDFFNNELNELNEFLEGGNAPLVRRMKTNGIRIIRCRLRHKAVPHGKFV